MQDKNIILTSLGGKKRGRKRKSKKTDSVLESFDLSSALSAPKAEFDTKKIQDVKDSETIDYTSKFDELKQVLETALSDKKKTSFTGFKKLDPRSIKKIDKFVFKTALVETKEGVVKLPALRTGGIVTSPTQALIGENGPEAVVPLEKLRSLYNQMNMSREAFGTMARNLMPNVDETQVDSMFRQITNPMDPITERTRRGRFDPSLGETQMSATNPVLETELKARYGPGGIPRPEDQESQQEFRARLDRITPTSTNKVLKTPEQVERERLDGTKTNRRDYAEAMRAMERASQIDSGTDDLEQIKQREQLLAIAQKLSPQAVRDFRNKQADARAAERMDFVKQPRKDLEKRRAEQEAQYQARADIPGTEANKKRNAERKEKRRKREEQYERGRKAFIKEIGYDPFIGQKSPHVQEDVLAKSPLEGGFGGMPALPSLQTLPAAATMDSSDYTEFLLDPNVTEEEKKRIGEERRAGHRLINLHNQYKEMGIDPEVGVPSDGSFTERYSAEENEKILEGVRQRHREIRSRVQRPGHPAGFGLQLMNQSGQQGQPGSIVPGQKVGSFRGNQIQPPTGSQVPSVSLEASQTEQRQDISAAAGENAALLAKREDQAYQSQTKQIAAIPPSPDPKMNIRQPGFTSIAPSGGATIFDMAVRSQQILPNWRTMMG